MTNDPEELKEMGAIFGCVGSLSIVLGSCFYFGWGITLIIIGGIIMAVGLRTAWMSINTRRKGK